MTARPPAPDLGSAAVLGGYGVLGRRVVARLVTEGTGRITVAGRRRKVAHRFAAAVQTPSSVVVAAGADAGDADALTALLEDHDVLVVCSPLGAHGADALVEAMLRTGGRVVAVSHEAAVVERLRSATGALADAGAVAVLDAGVDPGMPGVLAAAAARRHSDADAVEIRARYRTGDIGEAGIADILDGAAGGAEVYDRGWGPAAPWAVRFLRFGGRLGRALAVPVALPELRDLPDRFGLRRLVLWHAGVNALADVVLLLWRAAHRLLPRRVGLRLLGVAVRRATGRPHGVAIEAIATGRGRTRRIGLWHPDVYRATAQSAVAATQRAGSTAPGSHFLHGVLDDRSAIDDLVDRGFVPYRGDRARPGAAASTHD